MVDKQEPQPTEEAQGNSKKSTDREKNANLMRKLLGDQNARKEFQDLDPIQKRDAEEQNQAQEAKNDT